jgi:cytochrome c-type biogenesis protein CcmH/NrfG
MTVVLISGALTFLVGLLIFRPFSISCGRLQTGTRSPDDGRRRELLRQLRDLDDDLAAGKLTQADHVRLRGPVEREAVAVLRRKTRGPAGGAGEVASSARSGSATADPPKGRDAGGARRWRRRTVTLLTAAGAAASTTFLLINAVSSRTPGQAITGDSVPGVSAAAGGISSSVPASRSGHKSPTPGQLAAVAAAEAQVKQNPKDMNAHLTLAEAYTAAGASQLAAVEYLAVTRLDPANAEANTNLALLAFDVGRAQQAKVMVDRVLAANPKYPEALYLRGLINLMGLRRPRAAVRDFSAYLAVAPYGSHRTAAVTLLAVAQSQARR